MSTEEKPLTFLQKAIIGAAGGLCLTLLKLIDAQFYMNSSSSNEVTAAYLTYGAYIVLGMIVAIFFTDHDLPRKKCEKNALILGLLAPSILIAIITNPVEKPNKPENPLEAIPNIGSILIPAANAQDETNIIINNPENGDPSNIITIVKKSDIEPPLNLLILKALGRNIPTRKYAFIIGSSKSDERALDLAKKLNISLSCTHDDENSLCAQVIQPEGQDLRFVTIGGFDTITNVSNFQTNSVRAVLDIENISDDPNAIASASYLVDGIIVDGGDMFLK